MATSHPSTSSSHHFGLATYASLNHARSSRSTNTEHRSAPSSLPQEAQQQQQPIYHQQTPGYLTTPQYEIAQREMFKFRSDGQRELLILIVVNSGKSSSRLPPNRLSSYMPNISFHPKPRFGPMERNLSGVEMLVHDHHSEVNFQRSLHGSSSHLLPPNENLSLLSGCQVGRDYCQRFGLLLISKGFAKGLLYWYLLAIPSTYTNSMIRFLQSKLALSFRTRLTRYAHDLYLSPNQNFYKLTNLDTRITAADQFLTADIAKFCDSLSSLYSNISKPALDLILFNYQLGKTFGKLSAVETKLEGDFRLTHARLITNSEEISFYNGSRLEKDILNRTYLRLIRHVNSIFKIRIAYSMAEDLVINPVAPSRGPIAALESSSTHSSVAKAYRINAGGRMMTSGKDLAELAGYTSQVYTLLAHLTPISIRTGFNRSKLNQPAVGLIWEWSTAGSSRARKMLSNSLTCRSLFPSLIPGRDGELLVDDLSVKNQAGRTLLNHWAKRSGEDRYC
ncbi:hypothetical protein PGT21_022497 [Puccinia graminis f. sp. tritici]|uniref:ABC transmembrane type-1 domain-containing protein n=1 Tax=Puccinia graminis f. sp. tritici TaxID=56615 RepID=A0A5B0NBI7_PUCGR|nr:hypothetical protein PGT21_022497 [Puccinia graminis f. sp. tritici]